MTTTTPTARTQMDHARWCSHATNKSARGACRNALRTTSATDLLALVVAFGDDASRARGIDVERVRALVESGTHTHALSVMQAHDTGARRVSSAANAGALGALTIAAPADDDESADASA